MDNPEEVMQMLERFSKQKQKDINHFPVSIPRELEEYINYVARTGDPLYSWSLVKTLFREKLISVITDFYNDTPNLKDLPQYPNVDPFNYETMKKMLIEKLDSFSAAPFTIQRICELLGEPRKQYSRIDKFMRAVEKNILVVSTQEPGRTRTESETENGDSLNGDISSEVNVDIDMDSENAFVVTTKDTSVTQMHGENHELTTITHETISLKKSGTAAGSKDEEEISVSVDTTTTSVIKEDDKKDDENSEASQDSSNSSSSSSDETVTTCTTFSLSVETHKAPDHVDQESAVQVVQEVAKEIPPSLPEEPEMEPEKIEVAAVVEEIQVDQVEPEKIQEMLPEKLEEIPVKIDEPELSIPESVELPDTAEELTIEQENELLGGVSPKRLKIDDVSESLEKTEEAPIITEVAVAEIEEIPRIDEPEIIVEVSLPEDIPVVVEEPKDDETKSEILEVAETLKETEWIGEVKESTVEIEEIKESSVEIQEIQEPIPEAAEIEEIEVKVSEEIPIVTEPVEVEPIVAEVPIVAEEITEEIPAIEMDTAVPDQKMALDEDESVIGGGGISDSATAPAKMDTDPDVEMEVDECSVEAMDQ